MLEGKTLERLSESFSSMLHAINMKSLKHPVFYNAPIGIRFEIGGNENVYLDNSCTVNPAYISAAFARAKTIYENLPHSPDILRIDIYLNGQKSMHEIILEVCAEAKLPQPDEQVLVPFKWHEGDEPIPQLQLYWDLKKRQLIPDVLLKKIIEADIGGYFEFASNVYFSDTQDFILFHLYDDRGVDLIGARKELIQPMFERFKSWISDYDRERINAIFSR